MFEKFKVPAVFVSVQASLALLSAARDTGLVVDIGDGVIHFVPIFRGKIVAAGVQRIDRGGSDLTKHLWNLLRQGGVPLETSAEMDIVREIKEQFCFVSQNPQNESEQSSLNKPYTFPDGRVVTITSKMRVLTNEPLFDPTVLGLEASKSLQRMIVESIQRCDANMQHPMFQNILICGGPSVTPGLRERVEMEVRRLVPHQPLNVIATEWRKIATWLGGSKLASHSKFSSNWIFYKEWCEFGPRIIAHKCTF
eukprot:TRINITY_DN6230_c0_g1_i1.p1 TRINITY_DN6230_c0_g1~~TRINITY_DN6230_c0_g1_i1.p1  ORF type:complete len:276 (-),score=33.60 TRINITY_DN6230_c0_g1_i1:30-785(-)